MGKNLVLLLAFFVFSSGCLQAAEQIVNVLPLGPGGCIDETSCRNYCETNLQDCIDWCGENQHELCGTIASDYVGENISTEDIFKNTGTTAPAPSSYQCNTTPRTREFETQAYYEGPLIDSHVHMPMLISIPGINDLLPFDDIPVLEKDVSTDKIVCLMDKSNIKQSIGFYGLTEALAGSGTYIIKGVEKKHPNRIIAFLQPAPFQTPLFDLEKLDQTLTSNPGVFRGYGELATYFDVFRGTTPNDSIFLETYKVLEKHNQIVMLHPTPENLGDLEKAIQANPNLIFLLHGGEVKGDIMPLIENNDNVYFDIDSGLSTDYLFDTDKEKFLSDMRENFYSNLEKDTELWKPRIEANPDKFVWGTDKVEGWHFDEEVDGLLVEYSRAFIGALDTSVQENFAYKNAERMLQ